MKKSLLLITTLFSILIFLFNFDEVATNNKLNIDGLRLYEKAPDSYNFVNSFELKSIRLKNTVIEELCKFAKQNNVEMYIRNEYANQEAIQTTDIYLYSKAKTMLKNVAFKKHKNTLDFTKNSPDFYSNSLRDKAAYDYMVYIDRFYRTNDSKQVIRYYPFQNFNKVNTTSFSVRFLCDEPDKAVYNLLHSKTLSKYFLDDLSKQIRSAKEEGRQEKEYTNQFKMITIMAGLSLLLVLSQFLYSKRHLIGVYKLLGHNANAICRQLYLKTAMTNIAFYPLIQVLLFYIYCGVWQEDTLLLVKHLCMWYMLFIALFIGTYLLMLLFIKKTKIVAALKLKKSKTDLLNFSGFIMKCCMLLLTAVSFIQVTHDTLWTGKTFVYYTNREKVMSKYYQLYDGALNAYENPKAFETLFEVGNQHGALLEKIILPDSNDADEDNRYQHTVIKANANYLSQYHLLDENHAPINFSQYDETTCFIPLKAKEKMWMYYGEALPEHKVYYQNTMKFYTNTFPAISMYEKDPIIIKVTDLKASDVIINANTFVLPKKQYQAFEKAMYKKGLDHQFTFVDLGNILHVQISGMRIEVIRNLLLLVIYIFCFYCMITQNLMMYLFERGHTMAIRYVHGWGFWRRNSELLLFHVFAYAFMFLLLILLMRVNLLAAGIYVVGLFLFDFLVTVLTIKTKEKRMIRQCLKGDKWQ